MPDLIAIISRFGIACSSKPQPLGSLGGMSGSQFWRVAHGDEALLLRRWQPGISEERLLEIHQAITLASDCGISCLPRPRLAADGRTFVNAADHLWEITPWLPGEPTLARAGGVQHQQAAIAALARLHLALRQLPSRPPQVGKPNSLAQRDVLINEALAAGWLREAPLDNRPELIPPATADRLRDAILQRLPKVREAVVNAARVALPLQTILGDARAEHFLFTGDQLTGLVDFGALRFDSPMVDLARLVSELPQEGPDAFRNQVAAYSSVRPFAAGEQSLAPVLLHSGVVLAGYNWLKWVFKDLRAFDSPPAVKRRVEALLERLGRLPEPNSSVT